jgi:hypothetical protein
MHSATSGNCNEEINPRFQHSVGEKLKTNTINCRTSSKYVHHTHTHTHIPTRKHSVLTFSETPTQLSIFLIFLLCNPWNILIFNYVWIIEHRNRYIQFAWYVMVVFSANSVIVSGLASYLPALGQSVNNTLLPDLYIRVYKHILIIYTARSKLTH